MPPSRRVAAIASVVIWLLTGPTATKASALLPRIASFTSARRELDDLDLVVRHAVLLQDQPQEVDVGLAAPDHADLAAGEILDLLDLLLALRRPRPSCPWRALVSGFGRRRHPDRDDVLAQRGDRLRILRQFLVAADHGEIGLACLHGHRALHRAVGRHDAQPDRTAVAARRLRIEHARDRLDHLEVVAVGGADGDAQGDRAVVVVGRRADRRDDGDASREQREHRHDLRPTPARQPRSAACRAGAFDGHGAGKELSQVQGRYPE